MEFLFKTTLFSLLGLACGILGGLMVTRKTFNEQSNTNEQYKDRLEKLLDTVNVHLNEEKKDKNYWLSHTEVIEILERTKADIEEILK